MVHELSLRRVDKLFLLHILFWIYINLHLNKSKLEKIFMCRILWVCDIDFPEFIQLVIGIFFLSPKSCFFLLHFEIWHQTMISPRHPHFHWFPSHSCIFIDKERHIIYKYPVGKEEWFPETFIGFYKSMFSELLYKLNRKPCIFHSFPEVNIPTFVRFWRKEEKTEQTKLDWSCSTSSPHTLESFAALFILSCFLLHRTPVPKIPPHLHLSLPARHWVQPRAAQWSLRPSSCGTLPWSPCNHTAVLSPY